MAFEGLTEKLSLAFKKLRSKGKLSEADIKDAMREVRIALLEADVNYKVVKDFVKTVSEKAVGEEIMNSLTPAQQVIKVVHEELCALMGSEKQYIHFPSKPPCVVLLCGLQGAGKTTHAAKLAHYFKGQNHRPMLVACDVYRPAAIEQLKVVGKKVGAEVFERGQGDPVAISKAAVAYAKDYGYDLVILDTAGRLHIDETLMDELKRIKEAVEVHETMLTIDAMTGQDAVNVAKTFNETLGIDSVMVTKMDGDTRGGAALSVLAVTGKPIKFVGMGEKMGDLEPFYPDRMASRILGMGDVMTLIEKAQTQIDEKDAQETLKKLQDNSFTMDDLLDQLRQIQKMGSIKDILGMLPGVSDKIKDVDVDEKQFTRIEAIITSMTKKERAKPSIINPSRKRRIAAGSGTKVEDVNRLLKQFEQMQKMMKQLGGKKGKRRMNPMNMFKGF